MTDLGNNLRSPANTTRRPRPIACIVTMMVAATAWAGSASTEPLPCGVDVTAEVRALNHALADHALVEAVVRAEAALARCPGQPVLVRLLARAQAAAGNSGAARELLHAHTQAQPSDCESWSHLAWAELVANNPTETWQALLSAGCPGTPQERGRWTLLEALTQRHVGDHEAAALELAKLSDRSPLWPEDDRARAYLERQRDPSWTWPSQTTVELALGGTTDAFAGSPTDQAHSGVESALARLQVTSTLRAPRTGVVTPLVELSVRGHGIAADEARELSYLDLGGRAGADLRLGRTLVTLAARREALYLNQDPSLFSEAWRGELDLQTAGGLVLFAGGGHRRFHDPWRTRREWDGGLAGAVRLGSHPLTLALVGRRYDADRAVYNQRGASVTAVTLVPLGGGWLTRVSAQASWDDYPDSRTWEALIAFGSGEGRRDVTARLSLGAWRELRPGLQTALTYEYGRRWSTIEEGYQGSFSYREHRVLASLRLNLSGNPWRRGPTGADHVPLDWGLDAVTTPLGSESIRDLVRQNEELRADCGCTGF